MRSCILNSIIFLALNFTVQRYDNPSKLQLHNLRGILPISDFRTFLIYSRCFYSLNWLSSSSLVTRHSPCKHVSALATPSVLTAWRLSLSVHIGWNVRVTRSRTYPAQRFNARNHNQVVWTCLWMWFGFSWEAFGYGLPIYSMASYSASLSLASRSERCTSGWQDSLFHLSEKKWYSRQSLNEFKELSV